MTPRPSGRRLAPAGRGSLLARAAAALLAAALLVLGACTTNPATGGRDFTPFMSPAQERQVGEQQHPRVLAQFGGAYEDPEVQAYVERIGRELAAASERPDLAFTFTVLNDDTVNAFALPGGYVYVTRGLIALANDEAELAGVIGHEIGHVTARHSAQRQTRSVFAQLGQFGLAVLGGVLGGQQGAQVGAQVGGVGGLAYVQSYSREQEFEADRLGVRYLTRAGYDPAAMATFLRTLDRETALRQQLAGRGEASAQAAGLFASHPRTLDRVQGAIAEAEGATPGEGRLGRDELLARIDGMIYGDDPSQGLVRDGAFVHPDLRFAFDVPRGFRIQNTPQAVLAQRAQGGDIMVFDAAAAPPGRSMRDFLVRDWAGRAALRDVQTFRVNGMDAAGALTVVQAGGRRAEALLVAIRHGDDRIYRFIFASPDGISRGDLQTYNAVISSFRRLSAEEAGAIRPRRLGVVMVRSGETVRDLAGRMAADQLAEEQFRVLNGLEPGEEVRPGQRVKLVVG